MSGLWLMLHADRPLELHDALTAWTADPLIVGGLAAFALVYARGRRTQRHTRYFVAGWLTLVIALLSPVHVFAEQLFSAHMLQHTLLMCIAAPLIALARPGNALVRAAPRAWRRDTARVQRMLGLSPVSAFLLHAATIWIWHAPLLYDASIDNPFVHGLQHVSFFGTALVFWMAVLHVRTRAVSYGTGVVLLFATAVHTTVLGALITFANGVIYPQYNGAAQFGLTALDDQQLAGLIMWMPGGVLYAMSAVVLMVAWLREAEKRTSANYARLLGRSAMIIIALTMAGCDLTGETAAAMSEEAAARATNGDVERGKAAIRSYGCGGCHTIGGVRGANGLVGPPLNGIVQRVYVAGVLTNSPGNMVRWIRDPKAVDSLTAMPTLGVSVQQARDITAYLYTLK
jgi:cytochrome c oxidase assembly factor CtaG/cytochrome c2